MGTDLRGPRVFFTFGNHRHKRRHRRPWKTSRKRARSGFRAFGKYKGLQRSKNRHASEPRVANFSLQVGRCMGERGELWRELFGHQGADGVLVAYDETRKPVLVTYSWLYTGCEDAPATSKTHSLRVVNMPPRPALKTCVFTC